MRITTQGRVGPLPGNGQLLRSRLANHRQPVRGVRRRRPGDTARRVTTDTARRVTTTPRSARCQVTLGWRPMCTSGCTREYRGIRKEPGEATRPQGRGGRDAPPAKRQHSRSCQRRGVLLLGAVPSHDASPTVEARHDTRNHHPSPDVARSAGPQAWRRWPGARRLTRRPRAAQRGSGRSDVMGSVWPRVEGVAECVLTRWTAARSSFQGSHRCVSRRPDRRAQPGGSAPAVGGARRRSSARSASWAWRSATSATLWPCEVQRATIDCASSSTPSIPRRSSSR